MVRLKNYQTPEWIFILRLMASYALWKILSWSISFSATLNAAREHFHWNMGCFMANLLAYVGRILGDAGCTTDGIIVYASGTQGLAIADHCLAIPATLIFAFCILLFPGPKKQKIIYLFSGMLLVQLINLFRLGGLLWLQKTASPAFVAFNHSYTYVFLSYGSIALLLIYWMNIAIKGEKKQDKI